MLLNFPEDWGFRAGELVMDLLCLAPGSRLNDTQLCGVQSVLRQVVDATPAPIFLIDCLAMSPQGNHFGRKEKV